MAQSEANLLLQDGRGIVAQSQKIVSDLCEVIDSKELSFLKDRDRLQFLDISDEFQGGIQQLSQRCFDMRASTKALLNNRGDIKAKKRVKAQIDEFRDEKIFNGFTSKCNEFVSNIQNDKDYEEEKRDNLKNLVAGMASMGAAVGAGCLIVLHLVPGVNFLLTIAELVTLALVGIGALISSVVNTYFYKKRLQVLKNDLEDLKGKVRKYQEKAREIEPHQQRVQAQSVLDYDEIDYEELDGALEGLTSVLSSPVGRKESRCVVC